MMFGLAPEATFLHPGCAKGGAWAAAGPDIFAKEFWSIRTSTNPAMTRTHLHGAGLLGSRARTIPAAIQAMTYPTRCSADALRGEEMLPGLIGL